MAASAERRALPAVALAGVAAAGGLFSGCVSTQEKNARAKLAATRVLEGRRAPRAARAGGEVRVVGVQAVRGAGRGRSAVVVELRNGAREPRTDVPVTVGVRGPDGRRVRLNGRAGQGWFASHLPAVDGGGRATWVFTTRRPLPRGRLFAVAGALQEPPFSSASALPALRAETVAGAEVGRAVATARAGSRASASSRGAGRVRVAVVNDSGVPQADVQVYALVRDGRRWVAAGRASVARLGAHGRATVSVPLAGDAAGRPVRVHAIPTIFE